MKYLVVGLAFAVLSCSWKSSVKEQRHEDYVVDEHAWAIFLANGFSKNRVSLWIGADQILENVIAETLGPWGLTGVMAFIEAGESVCDVYLVRDL